MAVTAAPQMDFWRGKRVLVTGHSGFKGSWLTLALYRRGAKVTGISLPPLTTPNLFTEARIADLCRSHFFDIRDAAGIANLDPRSAARDRFPSRGATSGARKLSRSADHVRNERDGNRACAGSAARSRRRAGCRDGDNRQGLSRLPRCRVRIAKTTHSAATIRTARARPRVKWSSKVIASPISPSNRCRSCECARRQRDRRRRLVRGSPHSGRRARLAGGQPLRGPPAATRCGRGNTSSSRSSAIWCWRSGCGSGRRSPAPTTSGRKSAKQSKVRDLVELARAAYGEGDGRLRRRQRRPA